MTSNTNQIIPKDCSYQCGKRIYWSTADNAYFEVFSQKRHICPNRVSNTKPTTNTTTAAVTTNTNRPYYTKKPWIPKPKMSNSIELLTGTISEVQKKYELLSDIITAFNGTTFGSQSHISHNNELSIVVYFGIPEGKLNDFKQKFNNQIAYTRQQNNYR